MTEKVTELQHDEAELRQRMVEIRDALRSFGAHVTANPMEWYLPGKQQFSDARPKRTFAFRFRFFRSSPVSSFDRDHFDLIAPIDATPQRIMEMAIDLLILHQTPIL